jgi:RNase adaptor protein for sRNA GlmZ degradation
MKKILQFGYSVRVPEGIPLVDCRAIVNPYSRFRHDKSTGALLKMREMVRMDRFFMPIVQQAARLLEKHEVIGIGCGYGVHRSGAVIDELKRRARFKYGPEFKVEKLKKQDVQSLQKE